MCFSMIECQTDFTLKCMEHVVKSGKSSLEVTRAALDTFIGSIRAYEKHHVFTQGKCDSWYLNQFKNNENGSLWTRDCTTYWWKLRNVVENDFILR